MHRVSFRPSDACGNYSAIRVSVMPSEIGLVSRDHVIATAESCLLTWIWQIPKRCDVHFIMRSLFSCFRTVFIKHISLGSIMYGRDTFCVKICIFCSSGWDGPRAFTLSSQLLSRMDNASQCISTASTFLTASSKKTNSSTAQCTVKPPLPSYPRRAVKKASLKLS